MGSSYLMNRYAPCATAPSPIRGQPLVFPTVNMPAPSTSAMVGKTVAIIFMLIL